ncbi:MAG: succinate dehydrogenase [Planctomycetota bacterium]|nr:succinate dehydrogenase [Planctomycetota bacterium]MEC9348260.1 succinate dehydrogenase [Planctomycetota bacterium]
MSTTTTAPATKSGFGSTSRKDNWWVTPLLTFLGLSSFIVYSTWAAFQAADYFSNINGADYLSPFYSPVLWDANDSLTGKSLESGHALFGPQPSWWPGFLPFSPAFLILWAPAGFRMTCYYYRGAYYKAFWADPPSCAVGEPRKSYLGENSLPLIIQNIHRYFLYVAICFLFFLAYDAYRAMWFINEAGKTTFGIGVGTIVLSLNVFFLSGYTLGCHSLRHLIGGFMNHFSKAPIRSKCYSCVSGLNKRHMVWAWCSLFWVGFTDVYVRFLAEHIDFRIL